MSGQILGFLIWALTGILFILLGICSACSKTPAGFWANVKTFEVTDVKRYNHAVGKLFCIFGLVLILLGTPLLLEEGPMWILLSVAGVMAAAIVLMAVYILVIEKKYKKAA